MPQQLLSGHSRGAAPGMGKAIKPLPRLPRGWSRLCHETGLFLRSIGLGILTTTFQAFFTNKFSEPEKVAISQSRVTALLRALIHVLPLGLAIFEIILNWKGHYVGLVFDKQNYLQFAAKAHEILMQASIATIILSYIRYQISAGKGMPFGAVLGALEFSQVSYLWSIEFWSAIMSKDFPLRKKLCFAVLILVCITVAATAGPSSANLLIARQGIWPMQSNYMAINATFQDFWPDQLDDEKLSNDCKIMRIRYNSSPACYISSLLYGFSDDTLAASMMQDRYDIENTDLFRVQTPRTYVDKEVAIGSCFEDSKDQVCGTAPQDVFTGLLAQSSEAHSHQDCNVALQGYHILKENYYQPYTTARCVVDTVQNSYDQAPLRFPRLSETVSGLGGGQEIFPVPGLTKGQSTYNLPGNSSEFRLDWVDLPQEIFRTGVPGAIIVHPQSSSNLSYNISTCTLNAGWGSSSIFTDSDYDDLINSQMTQLPPSWSTNLTFSPVDTYKYLFSNKPRFRNISDFSYPQLRINISKSWMELINPTVILMDNTTTNPVSMVLSQLSSQPKGFEIAWLLNLLFAVGLSATGKEHDGEVFEKRSQASESCETCLFFEIEHLFYGWEYTTRETTTRLAIAVMLAYCVLVVAHLIYSAVSGISSTAWDSTAELVALAMNSSPTETLQNTCAGILGKRAYQTRVRVLKTSEKHLELVFGEVKDPNADISQLAMNEKYGSIVAGKEDDDELFKMEQEEIQKKKGG